jgi:catechol 2,3-dioxygenase-like lactoylglutathione lyase family enzyme
MNRILQLPVLALALLVGGHLARAAQALSQPSFTAKGAFFALSVPDLESSARWYAEKFGLKIVMQAPKTKTMKSAVTVLAGGGLLVELIQNDDARPLSKIASGIQGPDFVHGFTKSGLIVDNLDETVAVLRARNVPIFMGPFPAHDSTGLKNLIVKDNAGNLIQFFGK